MCEGCEEVRFEEVSSSERRVKPSHACPVWPNLRNYDEEAKHLTLDTTIIATFGCGSEDFALQRP